MNIRSFNFKLIFNSLETPSAILDWNNNYGEDPNGYGVVEISNLQDLLKSLCFGGFAHHVAATLNKVGDIVEEALSKYLDYNILFHNKEI